MNVTNAVRPSLRVKEVVLSLRHTRSVLAGMVVHR